MNNSKSSAAARSSRPTYASESQPVVELLTKVEGDLAGGEPAKALQRLNQSKLRSPWITNAIGVCQLRLGKPNVAVDIFRGLVLGAGGVNLRTDVPAVFRTNFSVALLQNGNVVGCKSALDQVGPDEHPAAARLRDALDKWRRSLSLLQKFSWYLGGDLGRPVTIDFPPGDLV